jgi:hypothetical protein
MTVDSGTAIFLRAVEQGSEPADEPPPEPEGERQRVCHLLPELDSSLVVPEGWRLSDDVGESAKTQREFPLQRLALVCPKCGRESHRTQDCAQCHMPLAALWSTVSRAPLLIAQQNKLESAIEDAKKDGHHVAVISGLREQSRLIELRLKALGELEPRKPADQTNVLDDDPRLWN